MSPRTAATGGHPPPEGAKVGYALRETDCGPESLVPPEDTADGRDHLSGEPLASLQRKRRSNSRALPVQVSKSCLRITATTCASAILKYGGRIQGHRSLSANSANRSRR